MPFPLESVENMQGFFWVLVRVSILFSLLPLFGARGFPALWKAGLSFVMALILTPVVPLPRSYPETAPQILVGVLSEAVMGLLLAFAVQLAFAAFQLAGQILGPGANLSAAMRGPGAKLASQVKQKAEGDEEDSSSE